MSDIFVYDVQRKICEYIDAIDKDKIVNNTEKKLEKLYTVFLSDINKQFQPYLKSNRALKSELQKINKKKCADKQGKIELTHALITERINLANQFDVLPDLMRSYQNLLEEVRRIKAWNIYEQWIDYALDYGDGSYLATHIAKLTHSSSRGSSIDLRYFDSCNKYSDRYLTTQNQTELLDTAYPDNKYSSISKLYSIVVDGHFIGDLLRDNGKDYLCHLTHDRELLNFWVASFSKKMIDINKQSYFLSKQIYFPILDTEYHLLLPLTSSTLAHHIHLEHKKYREELYKSAFKQKEEKKYSPTRVSIYPNKASLNITSSNHSNASSLNGKRGGRLTLMSALPPIWSTQPPSYVDKSNLFSKPLAAELREEITALANYLNLLKNRQLSISEPKRNAAIATKLRAINSQLFNYIEAINEAELNEGWTLTSQLPIEYQLLFEPWRHDDIAKACKLNKAWQIKLSQDFGRWLNQQLNKKKSLKLTPIHAELWADCFLVDLREFIAVKEVTL